MFHALRPQSKQPSLQMRVFPNWVSFSDSQKRTPRSYNTSQQYATVRVEFRVQAFLVFPYLESGFQEEGPRWPDDWPGESVGAIRGLSGGPGPGVHGGLGFRS